MAAYAATVTVNGRVPKRIAPGIGMLLGTVDITNYNSTLAEITGITQRLKTIYAVATAGLTDNGYSVTWNNTSGAFEAYAAAGTFTGTEKPPLVVIEESVTVTSHTGTLAHLPAYIFSVEVTAGDSTPHCHVIPTGESPAQSEVACTFTSGVLTFNATDNVTTVLVSYIPQQQSGPFASGNMVVDETVVASASKVSLANRAMCIQYVYNTTNSANTTLEPVGEAPTATGNAVIDILNGTSGTDIDTHADDDGDTLTVTYLKYSGFENAGAIFVNDADITLNSEVWAFLEGADGTYADFIIPGYGTHLVGEETTANQDIPIGGPSTTAAENIAKFDPITRILTTAQTGTMTTVSIPWMILDESLVANTPAGSVSASAGSEAANDTDVGAVNFVAIGVMN